jgi:hypothetical protein
MDITDYLIEIADECALVAKTGRMLVAQFDATVGPGPTAPLSQLSDAGKSLTDQVDRIAQSLLAKAIEIDHERQRRPQALS